ncbi:MAG: hypothetical protein M1819_003759 [Sarea resinae]|nr:MAG: hypothetical protein M1819_003759 [Sarea resinae]
MSSFRPDPRNPERKTQRSNDQFPANLSVDTGRDPYSYEAQDYRPYFASHNTPPYSTFPGESYLRGIEPDLREANPGALGISYAHASIPEENMPRAAPRPRSPRSLKGSPSHSSSSRLTPTSTEERRLSRAGEVEDEMDSGENDEEDGDEPQSEQKIDKRKMKRFRLTHNQTRYLMSEFARQAHPDAGHRERLSREIPGLSPRQVQVWFQNRRAKLKRLTTDDRERMMRSRTLPEDFDMAQALRSPYGVSQGGATASIPSPSTYSPVNHGSSFGGLMALDGMRRASADSGMSPIGLSPAFTDFSFNADHGSNLVSPVSTASQNSPITLMSGSGNISPKNTNPFVGAGPGDPSSGVTSPPQIPRLQIHDRVFGARAESIASPLRTSMSYTGTSLEHGQFHPNSQLRGPLSQSLSRYDLPAESPMAHDVDPSYRWMQGGPFSSSQAEPSTGFQSAPLTAPREFSLQSHIVGSFDDSYMPRPTSGELSGRPTGIAAAAAAAAVDPSRSRDPHQGGQQQRGAIVVSDEDNNDKRDLRMRTASSEEETRRGSFAYPLDYRSAQ